MLNKLLAKLNGSIGNPAALAKLLADLERDRAEAGTDLLALRERRKQALLDDASDQALDKIERDIDRKQTRIEQIELSVPAVRERLTEAQIAARKAAEPGFVTEYGATFSDYCKALRVLADASRRQAEVRARAMKVLGPQRTAVLLPDYAYGGVLTAPNIDEWIARNARELELSAGTRSHPSTALPPRVPPPPRETLQHAVSSGTGEGSIPKARRVADDLAPLEPGQARVKVMRAGFSPADDRPQAAYGQVLRMPVSAAARAQDRGAVTIIEGAP